jgi:hypothetical protein
VTAAPPAALVMALQATIAALEAGDIEAAAAGIDQVTRACEEAVRLGTVFSPDELAQARSLHERCAALATHTQGVVVAEVLQTSTQRKASHAYGSNS